MEYSELVKNSQKAVTAREQNRQDEAVSDPSKLSFGERLKNSIANIAEKTKNLVDKLEQNLTQMTQAGERFSGNMKVALEIVQSVSTDANKAVSESAQRSIESIKNTPSWVMEGIRNAALNLEDARKDQTKKMEDSIKLIANRAQAFGVKIVVDAQGRIEKAKKDRDEKKQARDLINVLLLKSISIRNTQTADERLAKITNKENRILAIAQEKHDENLAIAIDEHLEITNKEAENLRALNEREEAIRLLQYATAQAAAQQPKD